MAGYYPYMPYQDGGYTNPYGSQAMMQNRPMMPQQPVMPTQQTMQQPMMTNVDWVKVADIEAVKEIKPANNQTLYIMNQNKPEFYVKSADMMGICTTKVCPFEPIDLSEYEQRTKEQKSGTDTAPNFVTHDEFTGTINDVVSQLQQTRNEVAMQINQMRQSIPVMTPYVQQPTQQYVAPVVQTQAQAVEQQPVATEQTAEPKAEETTTKSKSKK